MKKISIITILSALIFTGCLKDTPNTDFSGLQPTVQFINAGLGYFSSDAVNFTSDTVTLPMAINLASVNTLSKDITVTIGVDNNALNTYNSTSTIKYNAIADSSYSLPKKTVTIPAGKRIDTLYVTFYHHTFDPSKNYMLPISITDASGVTIASNFQTHYFHVIGNPIAGTYEEYWSRWNGQSDSSGGEATAAYYKADVGTVVFAPNSPTEVQTTSLGTGETDIIDFDNNGGVLSNFTASFPAGEAATLQLTSIGTPTVEVANPATGYYRISFPYVNGSGLPRFIVNEYIKQ